MLALWVSVQGNVGSEANDVSRNQNSQNKECSLHVGKTSALKFTAAKQV